MVVTCEVGGWKKEEEANEKEAGRGEPRKEAGSASAGAAGRFGSCLQLLRVSVQMRCRECYDGPKEEQCIQRTYSCED